MTTINRICSKCHEQKPIEQFSRDLRRRDGYVSACKSCCALSAKRWYQANKVKALETSSKWRSLNKLRERETAAAYRKNNAESFRIKNRNRRAAIANVGGRLSKGIEEKLYKLQQGKCTCCGIPLNGKYHLDHILPLALGGSNHDRNVQLLHPLCNLKKRSTHPVEFMQKMGYLL